MTPQQRDVMRDLVQRAVRDVPDVHTTDVRLPNETPVAMRRRRRMRRLQPMGNEPGFLTLVSDDEGVLRWHMDAGASDFAARGRRAGRRGVAPFRGDVVEQLKYEPLEGSKVASFLDQLDHGFNPVRGICELGPTGWSAPGVAPVQSGRILLFIHGTFSKAAVLHDGLVASAEGRALMKSAAKTYDQVLAFQHPTLSVSPVLNAVDLARLFATSKAAIDVVCHSRGGLVTRWWLEALDPQPARKTKVVFVGSPLQGTSLASPQQLRRAMNLLTNVAFAIRATSTLASLAVPMLAVVAGIMRLVGSATQAVASTPVADAAIATIPGLAAQSRMENNFELRRLGQGISAAPASYFVVQSNFEPTDPGWKFWQYFTTQPVQRVLNAGADVVFPSTNDLVVDTTSMTELDGTANPVLAIPTGACVHDFGTNPTVHHLNYFEQPDTAKFIKSCFGL
jgi:hypothetical protein